MDCCFRVGFEGIRLPPVFLFIILKEEKAIWKTPLCKVHASVQGTSPEQRRYAVLLWALEFYFALFRCRWLRFTCLCFEVLGYCVHGATAIGPLFRSGCRRFTCLRFQVIGYGVHGATAIGNQEGEGWKLEGARMKCQEATRSCLCQTGASGS